MHSSSLSLVLLCVCISLSTASILMVLPNAGQKNTKVLSNLYHLDETTQQFSLVPPILFPAKEPGDFQSQTWDFSTTLRIESDLYYLTRNEVTGVINLNQLPSKDVTQRHNVTVSESLPISGEPCEIRFTREVFGLAYDRKTQSILTVGINFFSRKLVLVSVSLLGGTCELMMNFSGAAVSLGPSASATSPFLFDSVNRQGYIGVADGTNSWFYKFDIATMKSTDLKDTMLTDKKTWTVRALAAHPTKGAVYGLKTNVGHAVAKTSMTLSVLQPDASWTDLKTWDIAKNGVCDQLADNTGPSYPATQRFQFSKNVLPGGFNQDGSSFYTVFSCVASGLLNPSSYIGVRVGVNALDFSFSRGGAFNKTNATIPLVPPYILSVDDKVTDLLPVTVSTYTPKPNTLPVRQGVGSLYFTKYFQQGNCLKTVTSQRHAQRRRELRTAVYVKNALSHAQSNVKSYDKKLANTSAREAAEHVASLGLGDYWSAFGWSSNVQQGSQGRGNGMSACDAVWSSSGDGGSQLVDNLLCTPDYTIPNATDDIYDIVTDEDGSAYYTKCWNGPGDCAIVSGTMSVSFASNGYMGPTYLVEMFNSTCTNQSTDAWDCAARSNCYVCNGRCLDKTFDYTNACEMGQFCGKGGSGANSDPRSRTCYRPMNYTTALKWPSGLLAMSNGDLIIVDFHANALYLQPYGTQELIVLAKSPDAPFNARVLYFDGYLYAATQNAIFRVPYTVGSRAPGGSLKTFVRNIPIDAIDEVGMAVTSNGTFYVGVGPSKVPFDESKRYSHIRAFSTTFNPNWPNGYDFFSAPVVVEGVYRPRGIKVDQSDNLWVFQKSAEVIPGDKCPNRYSCNFEGAYRVHDGQFLGYPYCGLIRNSSRVGYDQIMFYVPKQFENDTVHTRSWCQKNIALPDKLTTNALLSKTDVYSNIYVDNMYWLGKAPESYLTGGWLLDSYSGSSYLILGNSSVIYSPLSHMIDFVSTTCKVPNSTATAPCFYFATRGANQLTQVLNYDGPIGYQRPAN